MHEDGVMTKWMLGAIGLLVLLSLAYWLYGRTNQRPVEQEQVVPPQTNTNTQADIETTVPAASPVPNPASNLYKNPFQ